MEENTTTNSSSLDSGLDEETTEESTEGSTEASAAEGNNTEANEETAADANASQNINSSNAVTGDDSQSIGNNTENNDTSFGTGGLISIIFGVIFTVLILASLWKMLEKLGEKGWKVLIPIYNIYILLKVAFGNNTKESSNSKEEFNFDDNLANIDKFNNDIPNYDSGMMDQSSRFDPNNNFESGINMNANNEATDEASNTFPDIDNNFGSNNMNFENNNQNEMENQEMNPTMNEGQINNGMSGMMPNEMGNSGFNQNPGINPTMNEGQMNNGMPGMMPNGMPGPMPEPNQNNQYNNGPMPMPGTGPNGMTKQCPNCHAPVPLNLVVCPNCGANVGGMN